MKVAIAQLSTSTDKMSNLEKAKNTFLKQKDWEQILLYYLNCIWH